MANSMKSRYKLMLNSNTYSRITCSAYGCDMRSGTNTLSEIKMFAFPRNPFRRRRWELATRRANWKANSKSRLCNKHFLTGKPSKDPKHPDYIPSVFVFNGNAKSKSRAKLNNTIAESCGNPACHNSEGTSVTSCCGIKGFCSKCFSSGSLSSAFHQSLAPINQTLAQLKGTLKDMEKEREQLRNELALCRHEISELHEAHEHCLARPRSKHSKPNSSDLIPSISLVDKPADVYDDERDKPSKGERKQGVSERNIESKQTSESPNARKSSDTSSPITIVYLKR